MSGQATPKNNQQISKKGGARPGAGRKKGVPNKLSGDVKAMILAALDGAGGVDYLIEQSRLTPASFLSLVGKVLPTQVTGADGGPIKHLHDLSDEALAKIVLGGK